MAEEPSCTKSSPPGIVKKGNRGSNPFHAGREGDPYPRSRERAFLLKRSWSWGDREKLGGRVNTERERSFPILGASSRATKTEGEKGDNLRHQWQGEGSGDMEFLLSKCVT